MLNLFCPHHLYSSFIIFTPHLSSSFVLLICTPHFYSQLFLILNTHYSCAARCHEEPPGSCEIAFWYQHLINPLKWKRYSSHKRRKPIPSTVPIISRVRTPSRSESLIVGSWRQRTMEECALSKRRFSGRSQREPGSEFRLFYPFRSTQTGSFKLPGSAQVHRKGFMRT